MQIVFLLKVAKIIEDIDFRRNFMIFRAPAAKVAGDCSFLPILGVSFAKNIDLHTKKSFRIWNLISREKLDFRENFQIFMKTAFRTSKSSISAWYL